MERPAGGNSRTRTTVVAPTAELLLPLRSETQPHPVDELPALPLTHYLWLLRRHRWRISAFVALCLFAVLLWTLGLPSVYESTATVDVDFRTPTGVVGQEARQISTNDADQFLATQVKLIQSDSVLRPVALRFRLLDREEEGANERGPRNPDAPVLLKQLKVVRPPNTYLLQISYRSYDRNLAAAVANAIAYSYLEHAYDIRFRAAAGLSQFMERQLEDLRAKMERSSSALANFERELSIINPEEKTNILSARLLELNSELSKAQADRVRKEAAFHAIREGGPEAARISSNREALDKLTEDYNATQQNLARIRTHYGPNHPDYLTAQAHAEQVNRLLEETVAGIRRTAEVEYQEARARERMLAEAVAEIKSESDRLNARSFEYQSLKREAETDKQLYEELLRKIREATINASFENSSIRVADAARPGNRPVSPNLPMNLSLALLLSLAVGVGAAVLSDALDDTVRDPEMISRILKTPVIGSLPVVRTWRRHSGPALLEAAGGEPQSGHNGSARRTAHAGLQDEESAAGFGEAIRTLRNSILLADFDGGLHSLLITSASPGEGKSTTASHLALAHAQQQKRTLLIDGDLRRPSVHKRFGICCSAGLSNVLNEGLPWKEAVVASPHHPFLDILPAGPPTRRASDAIGKGLTDLLEEASREYGLIILDGPPLLGFAEPLQMATAADGVIVVTRAGDTNRKAVASVVATLRRLRANLVGIVLNEVHRETSASYYHYYSGYYRRYYRDAERRARRAEG